MTSVQDLLISGTVFCRACLATGDHLKVSEFDEKRRYFDEFRIEELEHPQCKWICGDCVASMVEALQFRDRVVDVAAFLKEAIATIDNNQKLNIKQTLANADPLETHNEENKLDWEIKSELLDDHDDSFYDEDRDDVPLHYIKEEYKNKTGKDSLKKNGGIKKEKKSKLRKTTKENDRFIIVLLSREQQIEEMKQMAKNHKYRNSVYKCEYCVKGFGYESTYTKHMLVHEPSTVGHKCDMCHMYIASRRSFAKHAANHAKRFKCAKCDFVKRTRRGVVEHYGAEHEADKSKVECVLCAKIFFKKSVLRQHMVYRHAENKERQECEHCGTTFRTIESLRRHLLKHVSHDLPEKEKRFPCAACGKRYLNATLLKIHQRSHDTDRSFYCTLCNKFYKSEIILKCHLKYSSKHYDQDKRIPCPHCDKRLVDQRDLARHIEKVHLGIANFRCHLCPRAYYTNNLLRIHIKRTHDKYTFPKVHMCDYCGKSFSMRKNLICHINTHTGEKPFACNECDARFGHSGVLYMHVKLVHRKLKRNAKGKLVTPT